MPTGRSLWPTPKYLSPEFHIWANEVIKERFEEEADPELGITRAAERAEAKWREMGWSEQRIAIRHQSAYTQLWKRKHVD